MVRRFVHEILVNKTTSHIAVGGHHSEHTRRSWLTLNPPPPRGGSPSKETIVVFLDRQIRKERGSGVCAPVAIIQGGSWPCISWIAALYHTRFGMEEGWPWKETSALRQRPSNLWKMGRNRWMHNICWSVSANGLNFPVNRNPPPFHRSVKITFRRMGDF